MTTLRADVEAVMAVYPGESAEARLREVRAAVLAIIDAKLEETAEFYSALVAEAFDNGKAEGAKLDVERLAGVLREPDPEPCDHYDTETWFSRTLCPEPCGSMHDVCMKCDRNIGCLLDSPALRDAAARAEADRIIAALEGK